MLTWQACIDRYRCDDYRVWQRGATNFKVIVFAGVSAGRFYSGKNDRRDKNDCAARNQGDVG